jgi:hypothetical protein
MKEVNKLKTLKEEWGDVPLVLKIGLLSFVAAVIFLCIAMWFSSIHIGIRTLDIASNDEVYKFMKARLSN